MEASRAVSRGLLAWGGWKAWAGRSWPCHTSLGEACPAPSTAVGLKDSILAGPTQPLSPQWEANHPKTSTVRTYEAFHGPGPKSETSYGPSGWSGLIPSGLPPLAIGWQLVGTKQPGGKEGPWIAGGGC